MNDFILQERNECEIGKIMNGSHIETKASNRNIEESSVILDEN